MLYAVKPGDVPLLWHEWMGATLETAVVHDDLRTLSDVFSELVKGRFRAWVVNNQPEAFGVVVTSIEEPPEGRRFWVNYAAGRTGGLRSMRRIMAEIEHIARDMNAHEIRLQGRDWRRVLPDYEATEDVARNEIRKVL